jgi:hypothetical protein
MDKLITYTITVYGGEFDLLIGEVDVRAPTLVGAYQMGFKMFPKPETHLYVDKSASQFRLEVSS